jgi:hypothetical protein
MAMEHNHWAQDYVLDCDYNEQEPLFIAGDVGRDFKSLIATTRMPYSWGDVRYGKCGLDYGEKKIKKQCKDYDRKNKRMNRPY